jgi:hypothetical protein
MSKILERLLKDINPVEKISDNDGYLVDQIALLQSLQQVAATYADLAM